MMTVMQLLIVSIYFILKRLLGTRNIMPTLYHLALGHDFEMFEKKNVLKNKRHDDPRKGFKILEI